MHKHVVLDMARRYELEDLPMCLSGPSERKAARMANGKPIKSIMDQPPRGPKKVGLMLASASPTSSNS